MDNAWIGSSTASDRTSNSFETIVQHFKNLTKDPETTAEFLKDLKFNSNFPEYQAILGYLSYWSEKH
jgi:hypothetical protein